MTAGRKANHVKTSHSANWMTVRVGHAIVWPQVLRASMPHALQAILTKRCVWQRAMHSHTQAHELACWRSKVFQGQRPNAKCQNWVQKEEALHLHKIRLLSVPGQCYTGSNSNKSSVLYPEDVILLEGKNEVILMLGIRMFLYTKDNMKIEMYGDSNPGKRRPPYPLQKHIFTAGQACTHPL